MKRAVTSLTFTLNNLARAKYIPLRIPTILSDYAKKCNISFLTYNCFSFNTF
jgi:hypothetical protein